MLSLLLAAALAAPSTDLVIRSPRAATVFYSVYSSEAGWLKSGGTVSAGKATPKAGVAVVSLPLPPGRYAVAVFQDLDADGKMKRGVLGVPAEPVAFSNGARMRMGPPRFQDAAVQVEAGHGRIEIDLRD